MSEENQEQDERTEEPTPQRREQAKEKGQIARSRDLVSALTLLSAVFMLSWCGDDLGRSILALARQCFSLPPAARSITHDTTLFVTLYPALRGVALALSPVLLCTTFTALAGTLVQTGIPHAAWFAPDLSRLNPLPRLGQLFSPGSGGWELLRSALKIGAVGLGAWQILRPIWHDMPDRLALAPVALAARLRDLSGSLLLRLGLLLLGLAAIDFLVSRWRVERGMRMSRHEIREELRQSEGSPQIKRRIRRKARELMRRRIQVEVPRADVVVVNPTHYAVALSYKSERMRAPRVVAKGVDTLAMRIRELARASGVPVLSNPPLARELHRTVKVGGEVPADLYRAVAEVLAFVYRIRSHANASLHDPIQQPAIQGAHTHELSQELSADPRRPR